MPVVTITSDFGLEDYYLAILKGALLCRQPALQLIDITHNIKQYDIVQAAFVVKNAYSSFPKGSIHILSINNCYAPKATFLAVKYDGHYFLAPDNGVFSLLFGQNQLEMYELEYHSDAPLPWKDAYAQAVGHLAGGMPINEIGIPIAAIEQRFSFRPVVDKSSVKGTVVHVDYYENAIVNISRELFEQTANKRPFAIFFKGHQPLRQLSKGYADVPVGETLCFFNSADLLEIAINMGKASSLLGLKVEDSVHINFDESEKEKDLKDKVGDLSIES